LTKSLPIITRYSLYALLIFTPLARGSVQGWAITSIHLITLIALTAFLIEKSFNQNWQWIKTPLDKPIIILIILSILSSIFSLHRHTSFWSIILLLNYLTIFYMIIHTIRTRSQLRQLIYLIIGVALFISVFGLFKLAGANPFPWWDYSELPTNRIASVYGNRNHLAGYMEMALPLFLGFFFISQSANKLFLKIFLVIFLVMSLIFSLSRGGWLGILAGLVFMAGALLADQYFNKKRLLLFIIGGFFLVTFLILASTPVVERIRTMMDKGQETTLHSRNMVWGGVAKMIADYPLLGAGPGTFAVINTQYQPPGVVPRHIRAHNDYLHFVSETGMFMIPVIIWMIIALYRKGFHKLKNPSRLVRGITLGALSGITAVLVHSIVDFNLHIPANAILFTILAALVVAPVPGTATSDR